MNSKVLTKINEIKSDEIHGAGWLSRQAINAMNLAIEESHVDSTTDFVEEVRKVAVKLMKARPSMVSIANYTHQFLQQVILLEQKDKEISNVKSRALAQGNELIRLSEEAASDAAKNAAAMIGNLDIVMTCSYSSATCYTFEIAKEIGTNFLVIIAESWLGDKAYGEAAARHLEQCHISVEVIPDKTIEQRISKAEKVLVGADSILADGSLINGTPTYRLARAAAKAKIAFYAVCETAKFDIHGCIDRDAEPDYGFERIPPRLIAGIVTEEGIMKPRQAVAYIKNKSNRLS